MKQKVVSLKGQLHVHTSLSDGTMHPQEAADIYSQLGYDFIAYCDHDHLLKPNYRKELAKVDTKLIILVGVELTVPTRWGYVHISRIQGDQEYLHIFNHPANYGLSVKETCQCIQEVSPKFSIDLVEISHQGFYTPQYDTPVIPYSKVATDDSHVSWACGRTWVEVACRPDKDDIIRHLKKGCFQFGFVRGKPNFYSGGKGAEEL